MAARPHIHWRLFVRAGFGCAAVTLLPMFATLGCESDQVSEQRAADEPGTEVESTPAAGRGTQSTYRLVVTNPMPHAMIVSVDLEGTITELGTVPAGGEQPLEVPVPPGTTVTLIARDEAKTHSPTAMITLPTGDPYATWTIESPAP